MDLTDTERDAAAREFWDGHVISGRAAGWNDMTLTEQRACSSDWLAKRATAPGPVFTQEQSARIAQVLTAALPKLLRGFIREDVLEQRLAALEAKLVGAISDSLSAIEGAVFTGKSTANDVESLKWVREEFDNKGHTLTSHTRQLSRHSDHLASLEAKIAKLSRGD